MIQNKEEIRAEESSATTASPLQMIPTRNWFSDLLLKLYYYIL